MLASTPFTLPDGNVTNLYERPTATVHYVAGTAGAAYSKNDCVTQGGPCPEWSERVVFEHGYLRCVRTPSAAAAAQR